MACQLKRHEKLPVGIRRIARDEAEVICKSLSKKRLRRKSKSVHKARITVKQMRSLLRLVRKKVGDKFFDKQNSRLRAIGQSLSPLRDIEVRLNTLRKLRRNCRKKISHEQFSRIQTALAVEREKTIGAMTNSEEPWKDDLRYVLHAADDWPVKRLKSRHLHSGAKRASRRFLNAHETAQMNPSDHNLHEWRKRTKDLYYQLVVVQPIGRDSLEEVIASLKHLGTILGDDHDLAMLDAKLDGNGHHNFGRVQNYIRSRRAELQAAAKKISAKIIPKLVFSALKLKR